MQQVEIQFDSHKLITWMGAQREDHMVAVTPICEALGIDAYRQCQKLQTNKQFNPLHMLGVGTDGRTREMLCIPMENLAGWLYTINSSKVKEVSREPLLKFQKQLQMVMYSHLMGKSDKDLIMALNQQVQLLQQMMIQQGQAIAQLQATVGAHAYVADAEASASGRMLQARKQFKILQGGLNS